MLHDTKNSETSLITYENKKNPRNRTDSFFNPWSNLLFRGLYLLDLPIGRFLSLKDLLRVSRVSKGSRKLIQEKTPGGKETKRLAPLVENLKLPRSVTYFTSRKRWFLLPVTALLTMIVQSFLGFVYSLLLSIIFNRPLLFDSLSVWGAGVGALIGAIFATIAAFSIVCFPTRWNTPNRRFSLFIVSMTSLIFTGVVLCLGYIPEGINFFESFLLSWDGFTSIPEVDELQTGLIVGLTTIFTVITTVATTFFSIHFNTAYLSFLKKNEESILEIKEKKNIMYSQAWNTHFDWIKPEEKKMAENICQVVDEIELEEVGGSLSPRP